MMFSNYKNFAFGVAIVGVLGVSACAGSKPYVPVVNVTAQDASFQNIYLGDVSGDYSMETIFPVEVERNYMKTWVDMSGGVVPDTRSWFSHFLAKNSLRAKDKSSAKYLMNVKVLKYWLASSYLGVAYQTDFEYALVSVAEGKVLYTERVTDAGALPLDFGLGMTGGGGVSPQVVDDLLAKNLLGQPPQGANVETSILKTYQVVIQLNEEKVLPRLRDAVNKQ